MFCFGSFLFLAKHRCAQNLEISGNLGDVKLPNILHNHNHADINLQKYFSLKIKNKKKATPPKLGLIFSVGWFPLLGIFGEANSAFWVLARCLSRKTNVNLCRPALHGESSRPMRIHRKLVRYRLLTLDYLSGSCRDPTRSERKMRQLSSRDGCAVVRVPSNTFE